MSISIEMQEKLGAAVILGAMGNCQTAMSAFSECLSSSLCADNCLISHDADGAPIGYALWQEEEHRILVEEIYSPIGEYLQIFSDLKRHLPKVTTKPVFYRSLDQNNEEKQVC